jgi:prepilin peptidase CpaA
MILVFIIVFCALIALGFGGAAAYSDATRLKIPNLYAAYIGAAFVPAFLTAAIFAPEAELFSSLSNHLIAGALTLGVTYALFFFKLIGGGDSKLLSVYALWAGLSGLMPLLFIMSIAGGFLGLSTLALKKYQPIKSPLLDSWIDKSQKGGQDVPYGVAIFIGALFTFWQVGLIQPDALIAVATGGTGN